jgi:hypothetical protein
MKENVTVQVEKSIKRTLSLWMQKVRVELSSMRNLKKHSRGRTGRPPGRKVNQEDPQEGESPGRTVIQDDP